MTSKALPRYERKLKALLNLLLNENGCALVSFIHIFLVDGRMVLLWVVAAFEHDRNQLAELL